MQICIYLIYTVYCKVYEVLLNKVLSVKKAMILQLNYTNLRIILEFLLGFSMIRLVGLLVDTEINK